MTKAAVALMALLCGACGNVGPAKCRPTQPVTRSLLIANSVAYWQRLRTDERMTAEELAATIGPGCCYVKKLDDSLIRWLFEEHGFWSYEVEYSWIRKKNERPTRFSRTTWLNECGEVEDSRGGTDTVGN